VATWEFVKRRTASTGGVWRSGDGLLFLRNGDSSVLTEADHQRELACLGYPVPEITDSGQSAERGCWFTERCAGAASLHTLALADFEREGRVGGHTLRLAAEVSGRLLTTQFSAAAPADPRARRAFFEQAGFAASVREENPDLDTPHVRDVAGLALKRLAELPMCPSHLDYGLPNAFPHTVIDWQHAGPAPLGYDVLPMLEIAAFKGGNRGYEFTPGQRAGYLTSLDNVGQRLTGMPLSRFLGEFLLVKCFFFLALMRPTDDSRPDKHLKWRYRRELFDSGIDQYEQSGTIDTASFPTLAEFAERQAVRP
jgi:Phosphotransferase enzyme family